MGNEEGNAHNTYRLFSAVSCRSVVVVERCQFSSSIAIIVAMAWTSIHSIDTLTWMYSSWYTVRSENSELRTILRTLDDWLDSWAQPCRPEGPGGEDVLAGLFGGRNRLDVSGFVSCWRRSYSCSFAVIIPSRRLLLFSMRLCPRKHKLRTGMAALMKGPHVYPPPLTRLAHVVLTVLSISTAPA